ncbi:MULTISPECIES: methionyl-tRNA formyltransferase [unclassified Lentimonas]|uniref:methionyl-tRNA formyltransferase n=1 Tax=unclassified Lentimonas TaxID=2630993 RepID=UPI00132939E9|nr:MULTISPECIES: methionyl-tRNA formyltransferase [unclassified Lentimonas]CAA6680107.1 Methionyl-tRNA formyltransferase (EC [Lentimonas sp. CC4]CAA6685087.1 Methionyl-tRNA formyltransferase (EC [Lentimonas sp. CC6]CAA6693188.1 Methionyl-tRNA formyltransferase (EC [Lentimonas sp. CC19]CAA6697602.1 Methionyl-tRNA formyltransferase (EC [Lentimonas sp. CC10]CAA7068930.1 Methionyl-tRNA formyltransferase (EC [Lentimonas sp. CC11]
MSELPNIVFFGSDAICLPVLNYLKHDAAGACVLRAVVSQPDRRQGRGKKLQPNPVAAWATENGVELLQPEKPTRELADWMQAEQTAVSLVMAYGHFLQKSLREAAPQGMWNFHGSLLPKYRGASPVETALASGDAETGVGLMQVVKEMDAGAVADFETVCIGDQDTGPELRVKVGEAVVPLLRRNLSAMLAGELQVTEQDLSQVTYCRKMTKEDGAVDFSLSASEIYDRLRAFTPWPGGYFDHGESRIKVGAASVELDGLASAGPGTVLSTEPAVRVATGEGVICFHELQRPGARMLPVAEFLRGYPMAQGDQLIGRTAEALVRSEPMQS